MGDAASGSSAGSGGVVPRQASTSAVVALAVTTIPVWIVVFVWTPLNFWYLMTLGTGGLALAGTLAAAPAMAERLRFRASDVAVGLVSAAILYVVFLVGREVSVRLLPFASDQIGAVYADKSLLDPVAIGLLLALIIGPGEEVFWRGFLQRELARRIGPWRGYLAASLLYAVVHLLTGNAMLVVAALTAGLVWGWLFQRYGRLWPGIISHVAWDVAVFLVVPLA